MKKVKIDVEEKLIYRREIEILVPDDWEDVDLERVLDNAQNGEEFLSDFMYSLKHAGCDISEGWDDSLDSPDNSEIECDGFEFMDDDEEKESA